jgi:hypothetical protein
MSNKLFSSFFTASVVAMTLFTASMAKAESEYVGVSKCRSSGQICGTTATYSFESSGGNTQLEIQASRNHCSAVKYVIMSGDAVKTTRFLNAGESAIVNLGELPAGPQKVSIGAIGRLGGCNTGAVGSWGSFVQVR